MSPKGVEHMETIPREAHKTTELLPDIEVDPGRAEIRVAIQAGEAEALSRISAERLRYLATWDDPMSMF